MYIHRLLFLLPVLIFIACMNPNPTKEVEKRNPWVPYTDAPAENTAAFAGDSPGAKDCTAPFDSWDCIQLPPALRAMPMAAKWEGQVKGFATLCAQCHGADGRGNDNGKRLGVKDLTSADVQKLSDDQLLVAIRDGSENNKMPSFKDSLSEGLMKDLVKHIRDLPNRKLNLP